ncbi:hypothetical protein [Bacillus sp. AFS014408]|uniref:hypothetical protein n=1 Tax=Bacillus sp. AFS014408 TaxID=2034278 RepID=UPI0015970FE0|nr:hypothetical protein [Bacillus sp. AFS014408]
MKNQPPAFLLGGREHLAMHRETVKAFPCHMQGSKQRKKVIAGHVLFYITATYMLKNKNEFI